MAEHVKHSTFICDVSDEKWCVLFLVQHHVFRDKMECPKCGNELTLNLETLLFRCRKFYNAAQSKKKKKMMQCNFWRSVKVNTWFDHVHLSLSTACKFIAHFLWIPIPRWGYISDDLDLSSETIVNWSSYCRELCVYWAEKYSQKLGGPGTVVEIDEAKFGKRKYNCGRLINGKWIFGGYERGTKKIFVVPVPDRTSATLIRCIQEWILPGTTIMSDKWKAYECLSAEDFKHLSVNHQTNFVDPNTGAHTQGIERTWREVRANISKYGTKEQHLVSYLAEYLFKRVYSRPERINVFFNLIAEFQEVLLQDKIFDRHVDIPQDA